MSQITHGGGSFAALSDNRIQPSARRSFSGDAGTDVRLECSITPGVVVDQYYVIWRSAADRGRVFYELFPPSRDIDPINIDRQHYTLNPEDFSLTIHDVTPADGAHDYMCVLGVEDTLATYTTLYMLTENVNLSLTVFSKSCSLTISLRAKVLLSFLWRYRCMSLIM